MVSFNEARNVPLDGNPNAVAVPDEVFGITDNQTHEVVTPDDSRRTLYIAVAAGSVYFSSYAKTEANEAPQNDPTVGGQAVELVPQFGIVRISAPASFTLTAAASTRATYWFA